MNRFRLSILFVALLVGASLCFAQAARNKGRGKQAPARHVLVTPDQIKWGPAPPGLPPGAELAVLRGDPSKAGAPFTMRAKFPDGYKVLPHWHPTDENVSVVQGTLMVGMGDKFDESAGHRATGWFVCSHAQSGSSFCVGKGRNNHRHLWHWAVRDYLRKPWRRSPSQNKVRVFRLDVRQGLACRLLMTD